MRRAPFITFEGPDGAGKSVQAKLLARTLEQSGWPVLLTREPGGTATGEALRDVLLHAVDLALFPETEVLLLAAGRAQHVRERIVPALEAGTAVICDRFEDSTYAYQGGGYGLPMGTLRSVMQFATGGVQPDVRVLIDVPVEIGLERRHADQGSVNRIDRAPVEYHRKVRAAFLELAADDPDGWIVIDGTADVDSIAGKVHTDMRQRVLVHYDPSGSDSRISG